MRNGLVIIDADAHVLDLDEVYRKRLPTAFRNRLAHLPLRRF